MSEPNWKQTLQPSAEAALREAESSTIYLPTLKFRGQISKLLLLLQFGMAYWAAI